MSGFIDTFIPLFVAVDAIGILPMYLTLTDSIDRKKKHPIVIQSIITALIVGLIFLLIGNTILDVLGISIADFMIAGGIILFLLSISDLLSMEKRQRRIDGTEIGPVPIGVPLIVGPAVLTTAMLLSKEHGVIYTSISLTLNICIVGLFFWFSDYITHILGKGGAKIISKLAGLLLASYGIMMIRKGIFMYITSNLT